MSAEIESVACLGPGQQSDVSAVGMAPRGHGRERPGKMAQNPIGHDEGMEWEAIRGFIQGNNIIQFMFLKAFFLLWGELMRMRIRRNTRLEAFAIVQVRYNGGHGAGEKQIYVRSFLEIEKNRT